jgi:hypothetical protein
MWKFISEYKNITGLKFANAVSGNSSTGALVNKRDLYFVVLVQDIV